MLILYLRFLLGLFFIPFAINAQGVQPHHTTAFIRPAGSINTLWSGSCYSTDSFWNEDGDKLPTYNHFREQSLMLYAEYSINSVNSLFANGGFTQAQESLNGDSRGADDIEIGWKHMVRRTSDSALTTQLVAIVPAGERNASIRYGKSGAELSILYSKLFRIKGFRAWTDLGVGYRWYNGYPSDQVNADAALGLVLNSCNWIIVSGQLDYGVFNGDAWGNSNNVTLNPNYRLLQAKCEWVYRPFSHVALSLGAFVHAWGQNVGTGGGYYCGAWVVF